MSKIILAAILFSASSVFAQTQGLVPGDHITTLRPMPGQTYSYDQHGNSVRTYRTPSGERYVTKPGDWNQDGKSGMIYEPYKPIEPSRPLIIPPITEGTEPLPLQLPH